MTEWSFWLQSGVGGGFIAWAKRGEIETGNGLTEPGEVHFACGPTENAALDLLKSELPSD